MKRISLIIVVLLVLSGCSVLNRNPDSESETPTIEQQVVKKVRDEDYEMMYPYMSSPLRQVRTIGSREVESYEIGRRLLDVSKDHFSVNDYLVTEGQLIDEGRYFELLVFKSDDNPNGLMSKYSDGLDIDGVTLVNPIFVTDLFEFNFYKKNEDDQIDGISIALVLKKYQLLDEKTGLMHEMSDDALFNVGQTMGLQLSAYLRSLENMSDVPIYIGLYVQSSDIDKLPGNYLPGYFIGGAYSKDTTMKFERSQESWLLLSNNEAQNKLPEVVSQFNQLKRKVEHFTADDSVGVVGKAFIVDNKLDTIRIDVNISSKTFLETYGLSQYISQEIDNLSEFGIPIKVNVSSFEKTRAIIVKYPNEKVILETFE